VFALTEQIQELQPFGAGDRLADMCELLIDGIFESSTTVGNNDPFLYSI
jgi:hypothetical protein